MSAAQQSPESSVLGDVTSFYSSILDSLANAIAGIESGLGSGVPSTQRCDIYKRVLEAVLKVYTAVVADYTSVVRFVGERAVSRLYQIDVEKATLDKFYNAGYIDGTAYNTAVNRLNAESSAVQDRWSAFKSDYSSSFNNLVAKVSNLINMLVGYMNSYCTGTT